MKLLFKLICCMLPLTIAHATQSDPCSQILTKWNDTELTIENTADIKKNIAKAIVDIARGRQAVIQDVLAGTTVVMIDPVRYFSYLQSQGFQGARPQIPPLRALTVEEAAFHWDKLLQSVTASDTLNFIYNEKNDPVLFVISAEEYRQIKQAAMDLFVPKLPSVTTTDLILYRRKTFGKGGHGHLSLSQPAVVLRKGVEVQGVLFAPQFLAQSSIANISLLYNQGIGRVAETPLPWQFLEFVKEYSGGQKISEFADHYSHSDLSVTTGFATLAKIFSRKKIVILEPLKTLFKGESLDDVMIFIPLPPALSAADQLEISKYEKNSLPTVTVSEVLSNPRRLVMTGNRYSLGQTRPALILRKRNMNYFVVFYPDYLKKSSLDVIFAAYRRASEIEDHRPLSPTIAQFFYEYKKGMNAYGSVTSYPLTDLKSQNQSQVFEHNFQVQKPVIIRSLDKNGALDLMVFVPIANGEPQVQEKLKLEEADLEFTSLIPFFRTTILNGEGMVPGVRDKLLKFESDLNNPWLLEEAKAILSTTLSVDNINRWRQGAVHESANFRIIERILTAITTSNSKAPNQFKPSLNIKTLVLTATEDMVQRILIDERVSFHPETSADLRGLSRKTHQALRSISENLVRFLTGAQRVSNVQNLFYVKDLMSIGPFGRYNIYFKFGEREGEIVVLRIVKGRELSQEELQNSLLARDQTLKIAK